MVKYAITFSGATPKGFEDHELSFLEQANKEEECNIFVEAGADEFGLYSCLVLFIKEDVEDPILPFSREYGEYRIYDFPNNLKEKEYKQFRDFMLNAYPRSKEVKYHPAFGFNYDSIMMDVDRYPIDENKIAEFTLYQVRMDKILDSIYTSNHVSVDDHKLFDDIRETMKVKSVMRPEDEKYYYPQIDKIICNINNSTPIGDALTYMYMVHNKDIQAMKRWFIEKYKTPFVILEEVSQVEIGGEKVIYGGDGFTARGFTYWVADKKITDFIIKVKYVINLGDGGKRYIVDLIGEKIAENVEFPNIFSKSVFKQKISHYGPFHFSGTDDAINMLHEAVSNTDAPEVDQLIGFGFHGEILACGNCVYNIEKKIVYERHGLYFFNDEVGHGYAVVSLQGDNLLLNSQGLPNVIAGTESHPTEEYLAYFNQFYKNGLGNFLFLYLVGLFYAGRFRHIPEYKYPYLILNGLYGSGKSAISDMYKRAYNVTDLSEAQTKYGETSPFSFINICSYRIGLPIFITEFKEQDEDKGDAKVSNLVSMYDRSVVSKGTASQKMLYYNLHSLGIIDGEELPKRSALKSRSIILQISAANNGLSMDDYTKEIQMPILNHVMLDALSKPGITEERYREFMSEGMKFFDKRVKHATSRLIQGFAGVYAGGLMFDENLREMLQVDLLERFMRQAKIEQETMGVAELLDVIKKYAKQMDQNECFYYDRVGRRFCIKLGNLEGFLARYRIKMSLGFDAIKGYLPQVEDVDMSTGEFSDNIGGLIECAVWPMTKEFPNQLLFYTEAYRDYKTLK